MILIGAILALAVGAAATQDTHRALARVLKMAASTAVIGLLFVNASEPSAYMWFVLAAFTASWVGDLALTFDGRPPFVVGLVAFAAAHVMYIVAFIVRAPIDPLIFAISGVAMAGVGIAVLGWLTPHRPSELRIPLIAYVGIISVMVTVAFATQGGTLNTLIPLGATAFAVSDILVARQQFVTETQWNRIVGLPLYFGAQILFALTV